MTKLVDIKKIIEYKEQGLSNRGVARETGYDRKTVSKYWNEYRRRLMELEKSGADTKAIQDGLVSEPKYNSANRKRRKYTSEIEERLQEILREEERKDRLLGPGHKQRLSNRQIHKKLVSEGYDVSEGLINAALSAIRKRQREVYIRQHYDFGDRLEYDFGEVKLDCGEGVKVYHMAVLSSPGGGFRWLYLYTNQKKAVFMDSHVKFFEMMGGAYMEVVYDNMRNVVRKFIGKNEKELNEDLIKMSIYYGFKINVTNCFKANEKGHVEKSVDVLRNQLFADTWKFNSIEHAQEYADSQMIKLNEGSRMEEEKKHLKPYRPPLELAIVSDPKVNPSSLVSVDTVFYSVPEYLVGKRVTVKKYHNEIHVFAGTEPVATHKRMFGKDTPPQINIYHYLNTLKKKPGAIRNSVALKSIPRLKALFDTYYSHQPRKFIELFMDNKELPIDEIIALFERETKSKEINALDVVKPITQIDVSARVNISNYTSLVIGGVSQ